jgi:hypothetical protein
LLEQISVCRPNKVEASVMKTLLLSTGMVSIS